MSHTETRGIQRKDIEKIYNPIQQHGVKSSTGILDATTTSEIKVFGDVCQRISVQATDSLVCDIEVSVNGSDFVAAATGVDATAIVTYNTHNVAAVKITRTSGTGKLHILGTI